jgi:hypothetical protein
MLTEKEIVEILYEDMDDAHVIDVPTVAKIIVARLRQPCAWEYRFLDREHYWSSGCSHVFQPKDAGTLKGRRVKYCPRCGGRIETTAGDLMVEAVNFFRGDRKAALSFLGVKTHWVEET